MQLHINNFIEFIRKATLNFTIDGISINVSKDKIQSCMMNSSKNVITSITQSNNIILGLSDSDEVELNFISPSSNVIPYLNLASTDLVDIELNDNMLALNSKDVNSKIHFCVNSILNIGQPDLVKNLDSKKFFTSLKADNLKLAFNKIKSIASKFKKLYFTVFNKKLYIETTDKNSAYENSVKIELSKLDFIDLIMCFDFNSLHNLFTIIEDDDIIRLSWNEEVNAGFLMVDSGSNRYVITSQIE